MARSIYQRPLDCCNPTELVVAKGLPRLSDERVVRWSFYYESDREGDFIILDEAQDHDTSWPGSESDKTECGCHSLYRSQRKR